MSSVTVPSPGRPRERSEGLAFIITAVVSCLPVS